MVSHEKEKLPLWLIERIEDIESYIGVLQAAKRSAFSLSISPVNVLTDLLVDIILKLRESYENEAPQSERPNPEIIFDEFSQGPLGNPAQRTRNFYVHRVNDPQMEKFLLHLAEFFSRSMQKGFTFQKEFVHLTDNLKHFLPPGITSQKSNKAEKIQKNEKNLKAQRARNFYHYRRRLKE